jgi:hypothetical protein
MSPRKSNIKPKTIFAKRLRQLIKDETFISFESRCCLTNGTVGKYMQGRLPNFEAIVSICQATGCDANWLLLGKGEPFPDKN